MEHDEILIRTEIKIKFGRKKREVENEEILVKEFKNGGTNCALNRNKSLYAETCWRLGLKRN